MSKGCPKCDSGKILVEIMWNVTGQEGNAPSQIDVYNCRGCGHRWTLK